MSGLGRRTRHATTAGHGSRPGFPFICLVGQCRVHSGGTAPDSHRIPPPSPPRIMSHADRSRGRRRAKSRKRPRPVVASYVHV